MDDAADEIRRKMQHVRRDVDVDVSQIVDSANTLSDWRFYVRRYPWLCVSAALAAGYFVWPRRQALGKQLDGVDLKALLAQAGLPAAAISSGGSGLAMKALGIVGPIAAKSAMAYIMQRLGDGGPRASEQDHASAAPRPEAEQTL